jgi:hypothetical protein
MIEAFKNEMNKSLKEIEENTIKQVSIFKEETNPLNTCRKIENIIKQVKEVNNYVRP